MEWNIVFKKVKSSKALENYINEKIERECSKFSLNIIQATVVISQSGHDYVAACNIVGAHGLKLHVEGKASDTHAAIDNMVHKLDLSLKKSKDKQKGHKHGSKEALAASLEASAQNPQDGDWDMVPIDAEDLLTYEKKKKGKKKSA